MSLVEGKSAMLRISVVDSRTQRRLVLEGKLIPPWEVELRTAWGAAQQELNRRELAIDLANVTFVSQAGESLLLQLMNEGAQFSGRGVFAKHLLQQLRRRRKKIATKLRHEPSNGGHEQ
jgi:ABC-type transporter Mla MlaB component